MRNYKDEFQSRVNFIKEILEDTGAKGIVFGASGGKDSALVGILCRAACENTLGVMMPCSSPINYTNDISDAEELLQMFDIQFLKVDLQETYLQLCGKAGEVCELTKQAASNIAPRLRMTTLYLLGQSRDSLVAGTGNRSERYMGYFTKWGDGVSDFNPIADLTVTEIYAFLEYLGAPEFLMKKPPSAGLYEGQTDEAELGISYVEIDNYLLNGKISHDSWKIIQKAHNVTRHKRDPIINYGL